MAVKVRERKGAWWVMIDYNGKRKAKRCASKRAAELARDQIDARLKLGQRDVLAEPAPAPLAIEFPKLCHALPLWIERKARAGDIRGSTPKAYKSRLATWVYPHVLPDDRLVGDLPVNNVTREMLGAVILRVKEAGRSLAIIDAIRFALRGYYAALIETKILQGVANPAADLKFFVGKGAQRKARHRTATFFAQEEGPALVATAKAGHPRWHAFILTGLLGGLRWGETAALYKNDIDWTRGRIHGLPQVPCDATHVRDVATLGRR